MTAASCAIVLRGHCEHTNLKVARLCAMENNVGWGAVEGSMHVTWAAVCCHCVDHGMLIHQALRGPDTHDDDNEERETGNKICLLLVHIC